MRALELDPMTGERYMVSDIAMAASAETLVVQMCVAEPVLRTVVAGGPRTGKTTRADELAAATGAPVRHTDDVQGLDWSAASLEVSTWFGAPGPWVIEGVAAGRALRKWLAAHPTGMPADRVYWTPSPLVPRTPGQEAMAKGCETVFREILPLLRARGVEVLPLPAGVKR
jgi:hypothetical protein